MVRKISRNEFIHMTSFGIVSTLIAPPVYALNSNVPKIRAIAFDAFPIFDPGPIFKKVEELFPERGKQIIEVWLSKQFSYQWLRILGNRYKNFWDVTKDALDFALIQNELNLTGKEKDLIMAGYENLNAWSDAASALQVIKKEGLIVCFLSNMTAKMLFRGIQNSDLDEYFDFVISTDAAQTYKPSYNAYQMALEKLTFKKEEILFVPYAAWDMAGAKWFGYPTFWVNRLNAPNEKLDAEPDGIGSNLNDLLKFVIKYNNGK